jgi:hypothetical protein
MEDARLDLLFGVWSLAKALVFGKTSGQFSGKTGLLPLPTQGTHLRPPRWVH